jgi:type IV pilus assembly protein PilE
MFRMDRIVAGRRPRATRGITLIELLIALAIMGVLSAVALPLYNRYQLRTYRTEVLTDLGACALAATRRYSTNFTYVGMHAGGVPADCDQFSPDGTTAADGRYRITVTAADANTYTLRATPLNGQVGNGLLELDASGARRWDKNNDGDFADVGETNWDE